MSETNPLTDEIEQLANKAREAAAAEMELETARSGAFIAGAISLLSRPGMLDLSYTPITNVNVALEFLACARECKARIYQIQQETWKQ